MRRLEVNITLSGVEVAKWLRRRPVSRMAGVPDWGLKAGVYITTANAPVVRYHADRLGLPTMDADSEVEFCFADPTFDSMDTYDPATAARLALDALSDSTGGLPAKAERMVITVREW